MEEKKENSHLRKISQLPSGTSSYSSSYDGSCGCGSCGSGTSGWGTGPNDCMSQEMYFELSDKGALQSEVYVCGWGWTLPGVTAYGSCGSCGSCGCGSCGSCGCGSCGSCGCGGCGSSGGLFRIDAATDYLMRNTVPSPGVGSCASHVRSALEAGGFSTDGRPKSACDYDTYLKNRGFIEVDKTNYTPQKGDIVVHEAIPSTGPNDKGHPHGHIAMYCGSQWVSDFVQRDMFGGSGYRKAKNYTILRSR